MTPLDRINAYTAHRMGIMTKEERDARLAGEMPDEKLDFRGMATELWNHLSQELAFDDEKCIKAISHALRNENFRVSLEMGPRTVANEDACKALTHVLEQMVAFDASKYIKESDRAKEWTRLKRLGRIALTEGPNAYFVR